MPVGLLGAGFLVLLGIDAGEATQAVGALLLLGLIAAPAGAAFRLTADPRLGLALSAGFGLTAVWAGVTIAYLVPSLPPSSAIVGVAVAIYAATLRPPLAAVAAGAVEHDVVSRDRVTRGLLEPVDRILELRILERLDLPARIAHEMVMVVAAGMDRLEPRDPGAEIDSLHEALGAQKFEHAVDARDPDLPAGGAKAVEDLLRGQAAVLLGEQIDHRAPRTAVSHSLALKRLVCRRRPFRLCRDGLHTLDDSDSQERPARF